MYMNFVYNGSSSLKGFTFNGELQGYSTFEFQGLALISHANVSNFTVIPLNFLLG